MSEDIFDNLEILDDDSEEVVVVEEIKKQEKELADPTHTIEKSYPHLNIILDEESRINKITKDALETLFTTAKRNKLTGEQLREIYNNEQPTKISVGVSMGEKSKVIGVIDVTQVRYLYNLVRNLKIKFEPKEGEELVGSTILALI